MKIAWISKITMDMPHKTSRLKLSDALIWRGHEVTLYMVKKFGEKNKSGSDYVICIPTIPLPIFSGIFYGLIVFFYFPILLKRSKADIIIIDCTKVWLPFIIPLKILNKPIVLDIRTLPVENENLLFFKISIYLSKYVVDGITTITPELYEILKDDYNLKCKNVGYWSSGVSIEDFNKPIKKNNLVLNFKNCDLVVAYHGDYDSQTRKIENIIQAVSKLDSTIKNKVGVLIIGMPSNIIHDLTELSDKDGIKEQVNILPKIQYNEIVDYLRFADVGIIPLPPELIWWRVSAPLKTLEYLAAGKPIIATDIPFHRKIFEKGNCGLLIESSSPEVIAKAITDLYKNKNDLKKMGEEGRKIAEKYYTWDIMAKKVEDFLNELLK
jgi:glycosyltransferase involved in cell wall biosynthesis